MSKSEGEKVSAVEFRDPPPERQRYDWPAIVAALKQRPNEWAVVFEEDRASIVVAIRMGHVAAMHSSAGVEVRTTNNSRPVDSYRRCTLWARYVPENDQQKGTE